MDQKKLDEIYTEGFEWAQAEITRLQAALDAMTAERDAARDATLEALAQEYILKPPLYNGDMQNGRRYAVRGVAMRLGVYDGLDAAIDDAIRAMKENKT